MTPSNDAGASVLLVSQQPVPVPTPPHPPSCVCCLIFRVLCQHECVLRLTCFFEKKKTGDWDQDEGSLELNLMPASTYHSNDGQYDYLPDADSQAVSAGWMFHPASVWTLEFDVEHPPSEDDAEKLFELSIALGGACQDLVLTSELVVEGSVDVQLATFVTTNIGQSNPCPCSENVITVTLRTSQPIYVACGPVITIQGLEGSITPDNQAFAVSSSQSVIVSVGTWTRSSGTLVLPLSGSYMAKDDLIFSFVLENQAAAQPSPGISISIGGGGSGI